MIFKGDRAKRLVESVVAQLVHELPPPIENVLVMVRPKGGLVVRAVTATDSGKGLFKTVHKTSGTDDQGRPWSKVEYEGPTYLGTWLPIPRGTLLARINAQGAAEAMQEAVEARLGRPWPFEGAAVKTKRDGASIRGWFHGPKDEQTCMEFRVQRDDCLD